MPNPPRNPRNAGRKPLGDKPSVDYTFKMTQEQRQKLDLLGGAKKGAKWIRDQIDAARL